MEPLRKVAEALKAANQPALAREAAEISLLMKKTAASEIEFKELPPEAQKFSKSLEGEFGKIERVWEGVHGIIVEYTGRSTRLHKDTLKKLMAYGDFRWVDTADGFTSVGMLR